MAGEHRWIKLGLKISQTKAKGRFARGMKIISRGVFSGTKHYMESFHFSLSHSLFLSPHIYIYMYIYKYIVCVYIYLSSLSLSPSSSLGRLRDAAAAKSLQSCPTLCDPIDSSPPGSSVPGILQARTLEWVAISLGPEGHSNHVYTHFRETTF